MNNSERDGSDSQVCTLQPTKARSVTAWIAVIAPAVLSVAGCFAVAPLMYVIGPNDVPRSSLVFACWGIIQAFGVLVTIVGVLGPGGCLTRSLAALTLAYICFAAWAAGYVWADGCIPVREEVRAQILTLLCTIPFYYFVLGSPLWLLRIFFGWRLAMVQPGIAIALEPITIRGWMTAVAMFSLILALGRHAFHFMEQTGFDKALAEISLAGTAILVGIGLFNAVPAVFTFLSWKHVRWPVIVFWLYVAAVATTFILVTNLVWGLRIHAWKTLGELVPFGVWAGVQTVFLLGCRGLGFRLVRGTRAARIRLAQPSSG